MRIFFFCIFSNDIIGFSIIYETQLSIEPFYLENKSCKISARLGINDRSSPDISNMNIVTNIFIA